ncbi:complex I NDUFA9 subunit family protein [Pelagibacterium xiamenense]|uniref:complex I NDUFA9 subunit family protein n=1 Tax=Pelagibacterium xiamenense TaxID=2901140 RepID=UPI001E30881E|nr:complex I NDUFA9 subunit family protein [Pelagibacterium xiamenense]MCD7058545.1 complex I NDUFA9 subunit family protein [Pelagibacterium xiamenense]
MDKRGGKLVTIFGGSGFIGTQLTQELARRGYRIRVAVRRPDLAGHVRMFGFPGQIQPVQANLRYPESVKAAVAGSDVVINLVGILFEKGKQRFRLIQTQGAKYVAEAARDAGVARLIHMSALGADAESPSAYARSKALGEAEVFNAFPDAIVIRPSVVFGQDDGFLNLFGFIARLFPVMPLIHGDTRFQPVYVSDVARAYALAVEGSVKSGKVYELGGPDIETMRDLIARVLRETQRKRPVLPVPAGLAKMGASVMAFLPRPLLTPDQVVQLGIDNVVSEEAIRQKRTFAAFGIEPTGMDAVLPSYMWRFRKHGEFDRHGDNALGVH